MDFVEKLPIISHKFYVLKKLFMIQHKCFNLSCFFIVLLIKINQKNQHVVLLILK